MEQEERKDNRDLHFLDPPPPVRDLEAQQHAQFIGSSRKLLASNSILSRGGSWVADPVSPGTRLGYASTASAGA